jgi:hypothetical protein
MEKPLVAWLCPQTIVTSCRKQAGRQQGCRVDPGAAIPDMAEARQGDGLVRAGGDLDANRKADGREGRTVQHRRVRR